MEIKAPFGFVTGCHAGDKFMVQATLASIKHYCPDTPICLVVDGSFDVSDLQRQYDLIVLRISELASETMRSMIAGNFRAKMSAMWEGPFDFYVWLDSDAIVWGDFRPQIRQDIDFQIFWKESEQQAVPIIEDGFRHYYFDPDLLNRYDPAFRWAGHNYFCSGTFGARRNAIPFEEWAKVESWLRDTDGLFAWGEMGMLNYLVHSKAQKGEISIESSDLQHVWAHHGRGELEDDCRNCGFSFPVHISRPRVAHFCYRKPNLFDRKAYSRPFTIARLMHYQMRGCSRISALTHVLAEEVTTISTKAFGRIRRILSRFPM